jgi:hypothetical protein
VRIVLFTETFLPKVDDIVKTLCRLLEHLAIRGHKCLVFVPTGGPTYYAKTPVVGLPGHPFPLYPELRLVPPYVDVSRHLGAFRPDVVHLVNPVSLGLAGLQQARRLDIPVVASYHTDIPGFAEQWGLGVLSEPLWTYLRWVHNQMDLNLCPSHATQAELEARGFQRLKVWSRGVDTARFHPRHRTRAWRVRLSGGHPDAPLLLFVSRLAPEKRVEWLRPLLRRPYPKLAWPSSVTGQHALRWNATSLAHQPFSPAICTAMTWHVRMRRLMSLYSQPPTKHLETWYLRQWRRVCRWLLRVLAAHWIWTCSALVLAPNRRCT